jgi:adenine-specific DNA-methyltransferase
MSNGIVPHQEHSMIMFSTLCSANGTWERGTLECENTNQINRNMVTPVDMFSNNGNGNHPQIAIGDNYDNHNDVTLYIGDRLDLLNQLKASGAHAQLIVTSPPYNLGKEYEDQIDLDQYIESQRQTIRACVDVLTPTGSICWQVGHYIAGKGKDKEAFPLDIVLYPIFKELGLRLKNRIVWYFGHGLHENFRFSGRHETILWFTQPTSEYTFNLDPIRIPQKYPGKRQYRGANKGQLSGNPNGKNPGDVWDMPKVQANHVERTDHPCQFPVALVERLLLATTEEGDLVIDPYIGVGSTAVACVLHQRKVAGADTSTHYLEIARERVLAAGSGTLRTRPMNKPLYEPDGRSSVSRIPAEWMRNEMPTARLLDHEDKMDDD